MNKCLNYDWVEICDPQTRLRMFVNLESGECTEAPPESSRVKLLDGNQWWEFYDQSADRYYYYNYLTGITMWERPPYADIIPLARFLTPQHYAPSSVKSESGRSQSVERQPQPLPPGGAGDLNRFGSGPGPQGYFSPASVQLPLYATWRRHPSRHSVQGSWASSGHGTLPRSVVQQQQQQQQQQGNSAGSPAASQSQQQQQQPSETSADSGFDAATTGTASASAAAAAAAAGANSGYWDDASLSGRFPAVATRHSQQQQYAWQSAATSAFPRPANSSAGVYAYGRSGAGASLSLFDSSSRSMSVASVASEGASSAYLPAAVSVGSGGFYHQLQAASPAYPLPPGWSLTLFRREHKPAKLLSWTRRDLARPLLAATEKAHKKDACDNFKAIQRYMGDRKMKKQLSQPVLAWQVVQLGLQTPGLRDEQLMQLCRQLTNNPIAESLQLGWELLAVCLAFFPPSGGFAPYLEGFLLRHCQRLEPACPFRAQQQYASVCYQRLRRILRLGARKGSQGPSVDEVFIAKRTILAPGVFGCSLEDLMQQQRQRGFPELEQPWILTVLTEEILRLGGQLTEGIFRHPGDWDALNAARTQLEQWDLTACRRLSDPRVAASLLTLWLRELAEPLIPGRLYQRALDCHDRPDDALNLVARQLSPLNQRVLRHVIRFLRLFAEPSVASVTGIEANQLALLMAPCLIRAPDSGAAADYALLDKTRQEAAFVRLLMLHLPDNAGLSSLSVIRDDLPEIDEEPLQQQLQPVVTDSSSTTATAAAAAAAASGGTASVTMTTAADDDEDDDDEEEEDLISENGGSAGFERLDSRNGRLSPAAHAAAPPPPLANAEDCT